jgi:pimeloyl-ACP methyl ester carboxylesterase
MRPALVFAHANGFPAPCYRKLFELLEADFEVFAPDCLGHDPAHPVSDGWPHLRRELQRYVQQHLPGRRYVLVGHSLGGYLSLMLAARDPDPVRCVVLLDSPLVAGWRAALLWGMKRSGLIRRLGPAAPALRRRQQWSDLDAVRAHFASKPAFARWDPEMLADYAATGTRASQGQRVLRFARDIEARIYATLPHRIARQARRAPGLRVGFVAGTESEEIRLAGLDATRRLVGAHLRWIDGGSHLYPFEQPAATAAAIRALVAELATD